MAKLRIVSSGNSDSAQAAARGKLFENISAEILRKFGYVIDKHRPNVTHAGMEIDIEGHHRVSNNPLYAECKCYSSDIDCPKFHTFFGKYSAQWLRNKRAEGIFLAIPGLNTSAMGFYADNCENSDEISIKLIQEPDVIELLIDSRIVVSEEVILGKIARSKSEPGDSVLICSDKGYFWFQLVIPNGAGIATAYQLFDYKGNHINDITTIDYLSKFVPEFNEYELIDVDNTTTKLVQEDIEDSVVELRGSSSCFEYQFPASPEFFVGRSGILKDLEEFTQAVIDNRTASRGILFTGNSGWGKSSLVLASINKIIQMEHYALAIDSRCINSTRFVLSLVEHIYDKFNILDKRVPPKKAVSGFQGAIDLLLETSKYLNSKDKLLFIFLDQFENVFELKEVLKNLSVILLKLTDKSSNVIFGFSWKTDLLGMTNDFPYVLRDRIANACNRFSLNQFTDIEINCLLDKLAEELHTNVRKDLRFLLTEFSQGYPWLLKKLCAHVKKQREEKVPQADIAKGLLFVDQLFEEDLKGLTAEEEDSLKRIANVAPVQVSEITDDFNKDLIQSLVDRRLLVKVGTKYDIYWDIFRDYLNTGNLPIQEIYLLRSNFGSSTKALDLLCKNKGEIPIETFKEKAKMSDGTFWNVFKDLKLLKLVSIEGGMLKSNPGITMDSDYFSQISQLTSERLKKNRSVYEILKDIDTNDISIDTLGKKLKEQFPYISANIKTWKTYARVLASWLEFSYLAIYDAQTDSLSIYDPRQQIREKNLHLARRRRQSPIPAIQFLPVLKTSEKIIDALNNKKPIEWSGLKRTTVNKSLSMLEDMGLISRKGNSIIIPPQKLFLYVTDEDARLRIAEDALLEWPLFVCFLKVLKANKDKKLTHAQLAEIFIQESKVKWTMSTTMTQIKIMLDWARHMNFAPGRFSHTRRGSFKKNKDQEQKKLFQ